jgi:hypothetical protein
MAAPKWGIFMQSVYADKKLNYGKIKEFEQPLELKNDPIYAESNFANIVTTGDSLNQESGNENSDDFFVDEQTDEMIDDKQNPKSSSDSGKSKSKQKPTPKTQSDY